MATRVLIVDDYPGQRHGLRLFLKTMLPEVEIEEATNGIEALEAAGRQAPSVILMDLMMGGMDGIEATRRIKASMPEVKIAVLTLRDDDESRKAALAAGADAYVLKGEVHRLEQTVKELLGQQDDTR